MFLLLSTANYTLRTSQHLFVTFPPLRAGVSAGTNQVFSAAAHSRRARARGQTCTHARTRARSASATHPGSNRWTALGQSLGEARVGWSCRWSAKIRCASRQKHLLLFSGYASPGTNADAEQQWHLWQVMIAWTEIWIMTDLGHLLQLKSLLLTRSCALVLQQRVPEPVRVTAMEESVSAFICCTRSLPP